MRAAYYRRSKCDVADTLLLSHLSYRFCSIAHQWCSIESTFDGCLDVVRRALNTLVGRYAIAFFVDRKITWLQPIMKISPPVFGPGFSPRQEKFRQSSCHFLASCSFFRVVPISKNC